MQTPLEGPLKPDKILFEGFERYRHELARRLDDLDNPFSDRPTSPAQPPSRSSSRVKLKDL
ncbi:hypothetical protein AAF712_009973, partial [Marasmius tenuissimus]